MAAARKPPAVDADLWRMPPGLQAKLALPTSPCSIPLCGTVAPVPGARAQALTGMVRVSVYGSAEPARVWCGGLCAAYGLALAEVRVRQAPR
ncbi:hypothetical protein [Streptomyces sp. IBSBF 2435]|uniref:hypothetical protein n=1 Tax=Streptomyces sp. IBSBF 2435 TaxID=2903531 RepID=UPI002FDC572D